MSIPIELLDIASNNEANADILSLSNEKIMKDRVDIINELPIDKEEKMDLLRKLQGYRYVDEIHELKNGSFLRWLNMSDLDNITLVQGAFFCEFIFTDDNTCMRMRNIRGRYFEVKMDDIILFQKLTQQEKVLLAALSYISSNAK
tara:strand:+ start:78 stop:512 length:435 start_codon:yes stop_codon:yes gene_type:complete